MTDDIGLDGTVTEYGFSLVGEHWGLHDTNDRLPHWITHYQDIGCHKIAAALKELKAKAEGAEL